MPMTNRQIRLSWTLLLLSLGIVPTQTSAQELKFSSIPVWWTADSRATTSLATGDVDLDGNLDLLLGSIGRTALYRGRGEALETTPFWTSSIAAATQSVCLGDIDGDGYLDLVCGNLNQASAAFRNEAGRFAGEPFWLSDAADATYSVALGDVDRDGDLDLVCGNDGHTKLFLNNAGILARTPSWVAETSQATRSVALGDVDGDGWIDLVCGNLDEPCTLYLNRNGTFSATPQWRSSSIDRTRSVALGDVDGDGTLDLVCGNEGSCTFYRNRLGNLSTTPDWTSTQTGRTVSVALGDMNGDGQLDLACGSDGQGKFLYVNSGRGFPQGPDARFEDNYATTSVLLADFDGDGDPDLLCGNAGQSAMMYANLRSPFHRFPDGLFGGGFPASTMAAADVDGDGDPDLVCGAAGFPLRLYRNDGGVFLDNPVWTSRSAAGSGCVTLADFDADGVLDLVCGAASRKLVMYRGESGAFSPNPVSEADLVLAPRALANGDVNGDGIADVAVGGDGPSSVHFGAQGALGVRPGWVAGVPTSTSSLILADIDGNGAVDLVCGTNGDSAAAESDVMYLGQSGTLSPESAWSSGPAGWTRDIAVGDIDGDGRLDLVTAEGTENRIYFNDGRLFSSSPGWSADAGPGAESVQLGDVNRDGRLDAVWVVSGQGPSLHLNTGQGLETSPSWRALSQSRSGGAVLADVDSDGDLDLVCSQGDRNWIYRGIGNPIFKGDATAPTYQLPNQDGLLRSVNVSAQGDNRFRIRVTAIDPESDPVRVVLHYQFDGSPDWRDGVVAGSDGATPPLAASPAGVEHVFEWDVSTFPFDARTVTLILTTISLPRTLPTFQYAARYQVKVGRIHPKRAQIDPAVMTVSLPTVTLGDSSSTPLVLRNSGNAPLRVESVALPSPELAIVPSPPFSISPGDSLSVTVWALPRIALNLSGELLIRSNDPTRPILPISVTSDVRSLSVRTRPLLSGEQAPLGDALTFVITPQPQVRIESGWLFYRAPTSAAGPDSVPLVMSADQWIAVIPGRHVTEAGLEYYIRVENSSVFAFDPAEGPAGHPYLLSVRPPMSIVSTPVPNTGSGFLDTQPIRIEVLLPTGASYQGGTLHYRRGGEPEYRSDSLSYAPPTVVGVIPGDFAGPRGVEYWVEVRTLQSTLTDPPEEFASHPRTCSITVQDLMESDVHPGVVYRMTSIPLSFPDSFNGTLEALLADQAEFGPYDPHQWRAYRYDPARGKYAEISEENGKDTFRPRPGRAFWLICAQENRIATAPVLAVSTPTRDPVTVALEPGWNQIGNPFAFPIAWDSTRVNSLPVGSHDQVESPFRWDPERGGYEDSVRILQSFEGYWVRSLADTTVLLSILPREAPTPLSMRPTEAKEHPAGWRLRLSVSAAGVEDRCNWLGVSSVASGGWDPEDRSEPPAAPGPWIRLFFPHPEWARNPGLYAADIRGILDRSSSPDTELAAVVVWDFDLAKSITEVGSEDEVIVSFSGVESVPQDVGLLVVDRSRGQVVDIRKGKPVYSLTVADLDATPVAGTCRFALIAGDPKMVGARAAELLHAPARTLLYPNCPNPGRPWTRIRYDLGQRGYVGLRIYDVRGVAVRVLNSASQPAGHYQVFWDGRDDSGRESPAGVYFCRLDASGSTQTGKMILVR
jgi:hypothetical protein